jgi:hypothetical protein
MSDNKMNLSVYFDKINVNVIENSSGIFVGTNYQLGWDSTSKTNSGSGSVSGDFNLIQHNANIVFDNDVIDMPINSRKLIHQHSFEKNS